MLGAPPSIEVGVNLWCVGGQLICSVGASFNSECGGGTIGWESPVDCSGNWILSDPSFNGSLPGGSGSGSGSGSDCADYTTAIASVSLAALGVHMKGTGDHLHDVILQYTGEDFTPDCPCQEMIAKMNRWGVVGTRQHRKEIVEQLREEASQRGWWRYLVRIPGARWPLRWMVKEAIRRSGQGSVVS